MSTSQEMKLEFYRKLAQEAKYKMEVAQTNEDKKMYSDILKETAWKINMIVNGGSS